VPADRQDHLHFLGTGGARFVMIRQARSTAGVLYDVGGVRMLVDPGPGCLVRCLAAEPPLDPTTLDAILLTHSHLDHAGDANVMIEAMADGGRQPRGVLYAPASALDDDPVVLRYVRPYLERIEVLAEGRSFALAPGLALATPVLHRHGGEAFGFRLTAPGLCIGHVADSQWFPELAGHYAGCDLLIIHVVFEKLDAERRQHILHLDADDAARLVRDIRPRLAILTHFGTPMLKADPAAVARRLADETGVEVVAATDGLRLPLAPLRRSPPSP
jgi:ribonuclease BN (tRNA processing enzyme)